MIQSLKENQGKAQVQLATFKKIMINADLIKQGYARADRTGDYKYKGLFLEAEDYARNKKVGIWKEKPQQRVKT
ncbi:MAG: hypothetical protein A2Z83_08585 [Omnitrophica bacterium GWA2_52_8]|nr:MAG: hypothetical protein A2Z83_08585 [Omnitrophica bacterium GWA2_52_8]